MGKQIIDLIGQLIPITGNSTVDGIIFAIIGAIAASVAFGIVGLIFDVIGIYDADLMSDAHWIVRVLVFAALTWVGVKIAQFINWLLSFQWWVYLIAGVVFVGMIFLAYYIKHRISKRKAQNVEPAEEPATETVPDTVSQVEEKSKTTILGSRYYCPRCHSLLVKRHGPYGDFYGCESYGKTGCRYTRKFL